NFDIEDLESLWKLIKERFEKTVPKNYTDDYLLKTLKTMIEQPDVEASVWRDQKGRYELAKGRIVRNNGLQHITIALYTWCCCLELLLVKKKYKDSIK
nr:hypothetical protein [Tanacetum cinerariifolium]